MPAPTTRKKRLFFSYGWQDNLPLLRRVKEGLAADGYEIWHDKDRISGGDAFAAEIEDGIRTADVVVAFMGPHSTRQANDPDSKDGRDSICCRELSMADSVKGHGRIVPVLAVSCTQPLLLQGLDYVDMTDCPAAPAKYARALDKLRSALEDALEGRVRYRAWYAGLKPLDFWSVIRDKVEGFYGRQWLFRRIDAWRNSGATQSLLILGDPGIGKSAVAAKLIDDNPEGRIAGYFFCQHNEQITLNPGRMVQTMAAQLAAAFPAYRAKLDDPAVLERLNEAERDPGAAWTKGVLAPLGKIEHPKTDIRHLIVDALDEALEWDGAPNIVGVLSQGLRQMPPWLRLIATARNEQKVIDRLHGLRFEPLNAGEVDNQADVAGYIRARLRHFPSVSERVIATLQDKSAGNFLYVILTLDDIEAGHLRLDELDRLSPGLGGRYLDFFERHFPTEADFAGVRRVLEVMVAAVEPLHESQIAAATGLDREETLPKLRRLLSQFFQRTERGADPLYAFYHKSISDWLTDDERRGADFSIHPAKGHRPLAEWGWREYALGRTKWSPYLVAHLPTHLHAAGRWDDLAHLLCDPHYLEAKTELGQVHALAEDLARATGKEGLPEVYADRSRLRLIAEALRRDLPFIDRHPSALFQCLWNSAWWYDYAEAARHYNPPKGGWGPEGRPWDRPGPKLCEWLEAWLATKSKAGPFVWVRSLRPPGVPLGGALRAICTGHESAVHVVAYSPDGRTLASGSGDNTVRLWAADGGRELACLAGHDGSVNTLSWSPDGRTLASGSGDNTVRLWAADGGRELACLAGHKHDVKTLLWSPDGRTLASGSDDKTVRLWAADGGRELACLAGHEDGVKTLSWSPDGRTLASGSGDYTVRLWAADGGRELACLLGHVKSVATLSWSPDGRTLASGSWDKTVRLWAADGGRELACLAGHKHDVNTLLWSPDGRTLASGSGDYTVRLWAADGGRELACLLGHESWVETLSWSPDGRTLASGSDDKTVRLWAADGGRELACLAGHEGWVDTLSWSPDGRTLASGSEDMTVRLWAADGSRELACLSGHEAWVVTLSWSPDGRTLASGSNDYTVRLWAVDGGRELACLAGHKATVVTLSWSPDGRQLLSKDFRSNRIFWDAVRGCRLPEQGDFHKAPSHGEQTHGIQTRAISGETVFFAGDRAVAWFPVSLHQLTSQDGSTWAGDSGSEVYLLRLEGLPLA